MKRVRVTVIAYYLLPDEWEIIDSDNDSFENLRGDGRSFTPDLCWLEASPGGGVGDPPVPPARWTSIDADRNRWFNDHLQETQFSVEPG